MEQTLSKTKCEHGDTFFALPCKCKQINKMFKVAEEAFAFKRP